MLLVLVVAPHSARSKYLGQQLSQYIPIRVESGQLKYQIHRHRQKMNKITLVCKIANSNWHTINQILSVTRALIFPYAIPAKVNKL